MKKILDETGMIIYPGDCLKVFHFIGSRRKKYYLYKWVIIKNNELYALHTGDFSVPEGYYLYPLVNKKRLIKGTMILNRNDNDRRDL